MTHALPCPFCGAAPNLRRKTSWGYYNLMWIECLNTACAVRPKSLQQSCATWTAGEGTVEHPEKTAAELTVAWNTRTP